MAEHTPWNCNVFTKQHSNEMAMAKCQCNNYYIKISLLKLSGNFTFYQGEQISTWCSHHIHVFVWILKQTVTNRLVFITKMETVYCAVCTESLYKQISITFKGLTATTNIIITVVFVSISMTVIQQMYTDKIFPCY
jgi:hypothetical protein